MKLPKVSFPLLVSVCILFLLAACIISCIEVTPTLTPMLLLTNTPPTGALLTTTAVAPIVDKSLPEAAATLPALAISYTEANPLTEPQEISNLLDILLLRQEAWFSRPGWYLKTVCNYSAPGRDEWMACLHFLAHVVDEAHTCREQLVYFVIDGQVKPFEIMLEDGSRAGFTLPEVTFRAESPEPPDPAIQCSLENLESVNVWGEFLLGNERVRLESFLEELRTGGGSLEEGSGATSGSVSAWQAQAGGQNVLALVYEIKSFRAPQPVYIDPITGQSLLIMRSTRLKQFDLLTGLQISEQEILYLQNGQTLGGDAASGSVQYVYYEAMPADLAQVYADTAARVLAELGR
jgi:hypothetical protein